MDWFYRQLEGLIGSDWRHTAKWFGLAILVGTVAGIGALLFHWFSDELFDLCLREWIGYRPRPPGGDAKAHGIPIADPDISNWKPWLFLIVPSVGGLLSGLLVWRFAPEAEGHGTDGVLEAYHHKGGFIRWQVPVIKGLASALTLGTGGSGGREGPIAQIGAGFGSVLARYLGLSARERRILVAAGVGAGVGAIFRAPLAGALFASEIHYRDPDFESEVLIPSGLASITSYCVFSFAYGWQPLFATPQFDFHDPRELLPYGILALSVSFVAYAFIRGFYGMRDHFAALGIPDWLKPALGGLLTGVVALTLYVAVRDAEILNVLSFGYGAIQGALDGKIAIGVLVLIALGKILTTGLTIGSGGSGGVFGPSMVIGGSIGGAVGSAMHTLMPTIVRHPGAYVLVGMAGFFAGAAKTPISTIIMVSEMSGHYQLLLPSLWVTAICYLLLRRVNLYEKQMGSRIDSPAHRGDFQVDILEDMVVADIFKPGKAPLMFSEAAPLGEILHRVSETHQSYFPMTDDDGKMTGIFSLNDIREFMYDEALWNIAIAADVAVVDVVRVTPKDDLSVALGRFTERNIDELPVVTVEEPDRVVGMLRRKDVVDAYNRRLWKLRREREE